MINNNTVSRNSFMLVISSPSGAGKTALANKLLNVDNGFALSVSVTTRPPRPGEIDGKDYYFVDDSKFKDMIDNQELLEYASVFSYKYGTKAELVRAAQARGKDILFDIDWQGAQQLRDNIEVSSQLVTIFILPPSISELSRRLKARASDSVESVKNRMNNVSKEISHWKQYDYVIINDDFEFCFNQLHGIVQAERAKRERQSGLFGFVDQLSLDASKLNKF